MSEPGIQSAINFLVPAAGTTHLFPIYATFDPASPFTVFFDKQGLDGQRFMPSGIFIDNSTGANPITVEIQEISWQITCPAGGHLMLPYPGPVSQHARITGDGVAAVVFVDFPVQPFIFNPTSGGTTVAIPNGADVALGSTTDAAAPDFEAVATLISETKLLAQLLQGVDSLSDPLPPNFDSLPQALAYTAGVLNKIEKTDGVNTWTQTYTYTGSDLTGISAWVKS